MLALDQKIGAKLGMVLHKKIFRHLADVRRQEGAAPSGNDQLEDERVVVRAVALEFGGGNRMRAVTAAEIVNSSPA
jgi:hypothetical protein